MKGKNFWKSMGACLLSVALLAASLSSAVAAAAPKPLQIGVMTDTHLFPKALAGGYNAAFQKDHGKFGKLYLYSEGLLESALAGLAAHAKRNGMKYVLITGDLTKDGELEGHKAMVTRLERFERETGLQVAVIPGNHDINNSNGATYASGNMRPAAKTSPAQYRELYKNLGYDLPNAAYFKPKAGKRGGGLSYAADLEGGYRLVALDTCKYSADQTKSASDEHETAGMLSPELLDWAVGQCKAAMRAGKIVVGMGHHNLTPHMGMQELFFREYLIDDYKNVRAALAEAGMRYYFSGHIHVNEMGKYATKNGSALYDISTASLASFPPMFREARFTPQNSGAASVDVKTYDADCVLPVTANGETYPVPFAKTAFDHEFSDIGNPGFLRNFSEFNIGEDLAKLAAQGGLEGKLKQRGILLGSKLARRLDEALINDPDRTLALLEREEKQVLSLEVSKLPSTRFYEEYGVGDPNRPGTLGDLLTEMLIYTYARTEDAKNNKFVMDAIAGFEQGNNAKNLVNALLQVLVGDLLLRELVLGKDVSISFNAPLLRKTLGVLLGRALRNMFFDQNDVPDLDAVLK